MLGLGQPGLSLTCHRAIERAINLTCWGASGAAEVATPKWGGRRLAEVGTPKRGGRRGTFATELAYPKTFHQPHVSWNVRERACLPGNVPSNEVERFHLSWLTRKRSIKHLGEVVGTREIRLWLC